MFTMTLLIECQQMYIVSMCYTCHLHGPLTNSLCQRHIKKNLSDIQRYIYLSIYQWNLYSATSR